ncbi:MAG: hypothetical protein N2515_04025, partial [Deltaproteobacteria bacterium]|nr:hypothetical protein [Deltaproteobacteria bacterium]
VWFAASVLFSVMVPLLMLVSLEGGHPWISGCVVGAMLLTRPNTIPLALIPILEILQAHPSPTATPSTSARGALHQLLLWLRTRNWKQSAPKLLAFLIPLGISMGVAMAINHARFENPFEFGHRHLMILWRARIEKWGLFNYHYLSKNLAVALTSLPWLTTREPHIIISRHGLALWVTTPALLLLLWPKRPIDFRMHTYIWSSCIVALINLLYQNTGWIQFGYRFATDYLTIWFTLLALGRQNLRSFGFLGAAVFAVVVNTFGAITFDRAWQFYDDDPTQERVFQPD